MSSLLDLEGVGQRTSTFRFYLLDGQHRPIGEVHPAAAGVSITRAARRSLTGLTLPPSEAAAVDPIGDRVAPVMVLQDRTEWPLGVFLFADATRARRTAGTQLTASLVDEGLMLDQEGHRSYGWPPGYAVSDAMHTLAAEALVPAYTVEPAPVALSSWLVWPPATTRLKVLSDLAALAGFHPPHFDNSGVLRLRPVPDLATAELLTEYEAGGRIIDGSMAESNDLLEAPNRFRVINTGAADAAIVGVWDVPASAPHSFAKRGFHLTKTVEMQGLPDNAAATEAARALGQRAGAGYAHASFASPPDPRHDTYDVVQFLGERYSEESWTMQQLVEGAAMRHELRRVYT